MNLSGKKMILVIEDDPCLRNVLTEVLTLEGYIVRCVTDALRAIPLIREEDFDLIITDLNLPRMNGVQFLKRIRDEHIPVMMLTGTASHQALQDAMLAGARDFYTKQEFRIKKFVKRVKSIV
jgi:DNA-binding response OmpR family regulator